MSAKLQEAFRMHKAEPGKTWYEVKMLGSGDAVVEIFGVIGDWEVDPQSLVSELKALDGPGKTVTIRCDSPGGSVPAGVLLMTAIGQMEATVVMEIWGSCYSMASAIAMACDEVKIARDASMMIHNPMGVAIGTADEVRATAQQLDNIRDQMLDRYAARAEKAGHTREEVSAAMDAEKYYTPLQAIEFGLADVMLEDKASSRMQIDPEFAAVMLGKAPAEMLAIAEEEAPDEAETQADAEVAVTEDERVEVTMLVDGNEVTMTASKDVAELFSGAKLAREQSTNETGDEFVASMKSDADNDGAVMTARPEKAEAGKSMRERKPSRVNAHIANMNANFGRF
ncbi:hypothetical protein BMI91_19635 [Thioclava sediminum]|uniref:ATP-dependent Clp protease proteolytic subunit n=1 Tax=Thioclava sediminum TaxID=1915319 RepID=A0ABX3MS16_9RHOB|nr:head maturation protease, ClpP-related [Thioclava sediminum]OOY22496.1 hypothetical protein BMI91_19635 [Thioclava sediminum]